MQKAIRIRDRYLQALEEERWELLPGDAYVKGFLRTYADYLGLDGNLYVEEYDGRSRGQTSRSSFPSDSRGRAPASAESASYVR